MEKNEFIKLPANGTRYWYITTHPTKRGKLVVAEAIWADYTSDRRRFVLGEMFETLKEAQDYLKECEGMLNMMPPQQRGQYFSPKYIMEDGEK